MHLTVQRPARRAALVLAVAGTAALAGACATAPAVGESVAATPTAAATPSADSGGFRILQAGTEIISERYVRTADRISGELKLPQQTTLTYAATFDGAMNTTRLEFGTAQPAGMPGAMQPQRAVATPVGDSLSIESFQGDSSRTTRSAFTRGATPFVNPSVALMELMARRARTLAVGDSARVALFGPGIQPGAQASVRFVPDSVIMTLGPVDLRLRIDATGRLLGGAVPSQNLTIERLP